MKNIAFLLSSRNIFMFCFIVLPFSVFAQSVPFSCGTEELMRTQLNENIDIKSRHSQAESKILDRQLYRREAKTTGVDDYVIPVVVHILHNNGPENISDAQVLQGLQHINAAFSNQGFFNTSTGVVTGIQFCLAKQDANADPTSGITRTVSSYTNVNMTSQDVALKNTIRWDPSRYLNIWLVNEITSESNGSGVAGYATYPSAHGMVMDGMVCEARYFGSSADNSKIPVHEMGHYLGLYHTFEGGCPNNNCLLDGDRVCDTPPDASTAMALCIMPVNTCATDSDDPSTNNPFRTVALGGTGDQPDMISNYMDYGLDICHTGFTQGQTNRMVSSLTLIRNSLLGSKGCESPCPTPIQISFTPGDDTVALGTVINFTNTTTGATSYQWKVNGTVVATTQNFSHTFNQQGVQSITLVVLNGNSICTIEKTVKIKVECPIEASFTAPQKIKPGQTITFTNTTTAATSYQWLLNGSVISSAQNLTHTFATAGGFVVSLVAYNGNCYDTLRKFVSVGACNPGNEGRNWQFGGWAGVRFTEDSTYSVSFALTTPRIFLRSEEGCVSMSDETGNFLFFANPNYVFNRDLFQMPNGNGLLGHSSATQMATVRNVTDPNKYYLFTLDAFGGSNGLRYSEIDMTLDGGLGDVVVATKNTPILTSVTEKITTVRHANGTDTWVIVHEYNSNAFFAYLVSSTGISAVPVVSAVGTVHTMDAFNENSIGQLKASPDGCKLALAISGLDIVELLNFNNGTGAVSNPITFNSPDLASCYGVEFSPDGSKLYVSIEFSRNIFQFNLNAGNNAAIVGSKYLVTTAGTTGLLGALQIGPFGKIYVARNSNRYLGVINNPNGLGASSDYVNDGIDLSPSGSPFNSSNGSLPAFNQSYFYDPTPVITGPEEICANTKNVSYRISGSTCSSLINTWTFKGKGTLVSVSDTLAKVDFNGAGIDTLIVERQAACGRTSDTIYITVTEPPPFDVRDTMQCNPGGIVIDAGPGFTSYRWHNNSTLRTYTSTSAGKYWVTVTTPGGCTMTDTIRVLPAQPPVVSLGQDTSVCKGAVVVLNAGDYFLAYDWQDHFAGQYYSAYLPGKYWVTVTDICGNHASDTIRITEKNSSVPNIGSNKGICADEPVTLDAGSGYKNYVWQDGSSGQTFSASTKGIYWVMVMTQDECIAFDTVTIKERNDCCTNPYIPNLVTLNNDGSNDTFILQCTAAARGWTVEIYNRWGDLMHQSTDYKNDWPNSPVSDGVYYYLVKKDEKSYRGWLQVIR